MPGSRSTRSATLTWSCSSAAASRPRRRACAPRCGRISAHARRSWRWSTGRSPAGRWGHSSRAARRVGASIDALVLLGAASRASGRNVWWVIDEPGDLLDELADEDRARLTRFARWMRSERPEVARRGAEELIERVLDATSYDLAVLAMPGGERRLANVRKLMRLGREHEALQGPDLRGFPERVRMRAGRGGREPG